MPVLAQVFDAPPAVYGRSNVYALQFSPDGGRLAIGTGGWYGGGAITLVDLQTLRSSTLRFADCDATDEVEAPWLWGDRPLTISGVCFDGSGRYLALVSWSARHHAGPTFVCEVDGLELAHTATFETPSTPIRDRCPTGVGFLDEQVVVRCNASRLEDVFVCHPAPEGVDTRLPHAANAHARMAIVGTSVATGGGYSLRLEGSGPNVGRSERPKAANGLVTGPNPIQITEADTRVTAIVATSEGGLLTGGLDGTIHRWSQQDDVWVIDRAIRAGAPRESTLRTPWAVYRPESVVGLCRLDADRWFSVDADGEILAWEGDTPTKSYALPRPGTPRALAVHPHTPAGALLAVGVKAADDEPRGYVACFNV